MKLVRVHPITEKLSSKGHPWILKDDFTSRFPKQEKWLKFKNLKTEKELVFFQDQEHKHIKGRIWGAQLDFEADFQSRFEVAIEKRKKLQLNRENYFLVFAESDKLPGLYVFTFKNKVFIQIQTTFWMDHINLIKDAVLKKVEPDSIFFQNRTTKNALWECISGDSTKKFQFSEFDCDYEIDTNDPDLGFYTDMSSIREQLIPLFKKSESVLNLFSYTGAYSVIALKNNVANVHSVDLSAKYMTRLESNVDLNEFNGTHHSHVVSVQKFLNKAVDEGQTFSTVICDPPSSSTDGKKRTNALKSYSELLPLLEKVTSEKLIIFLNTHRVPRDKFKKEIQHIIQKRQLKLTPISEFYLSKDCTRIKNFPEGDYLKGILLKKTI